MRVAVVLFISCWLLSCAGQSPAPLESESNPPDRIPEKIVLEKEISGRVLAYDLQHPGGIAVDAQGNFYVSDSDNHRIIKFDPQYRPLHDFGGYGSGFGKFLNPEDMILDRGLNLYVLDTGNRRVVQLDVRLNYIEEILPEDDSTEIISNRGKLSGLQISSLGEITVADFDNSRLIKLDNFNRFSRYIGDFGYGRGALLNPLDLAIDRNGRIYVADAGNGRIAAFDDYGNYLREIGGEVLMRPSAVAVSPYGLIWVADQELKEILVFASHGNLLLRLGKTTVKEIAGANIKAMAVSADSRLYIADAGGNQILVYNIVYEGNR
jgi:DNA-binding beta-propeller fold protein YncE